MKSHESALCAAVVATPSVDSLFLYEECDSNLVQIHESDDKIGEEVLWRIGGGGAFSAMPFVVHMLMLESISLAGSS